MLKTREERRVRTCSSKRERSRSRKRLKRMGTKKPRGTANSDLRRGSDKVRKCTLPSRGLSTEKYTQKKRGGKERDYTLSHSGEKKTTGERNQHAGTKASAWSSIMPLTKLLASRIR